MRPIVAILFGIVMIYIWNFLLVQIGAKPFLWAAYLMLGLLVPVVYSGSEKPSIKAPIFLVLFFVLGVSAADIALTGVLFTSLLLITLADTLVKLAVSFAGLGLYLLLAYKAFHSENKILFTSSGTLVRRLLAALLDLNIILLIFGALTLASFLLPLGQLAIAAGTVLIVFAYKTSYEAQFGQTPGKKILGISVQNPTILKASIRNIPIGLLFAAPALGPAATAILYPIIFIDFILILTGKRLFDWAAGTSVEDK